MWGSGMITIWVLRKGGGVPVIQKLADGLKLSFCSTADGGVEADAHCVFRIEVQFVPGLD